MNKHIWSMAGRLAFWVGWPAWWLLLRWSTRTRVIIVSSTKNVLLVRGWLGTGDWGLPGGGLHRGEDATNGAIREVYEETGIKLKPDQLEPLGSTVIREYGLQCRCVNFVVQLPLEPEIKVQKFELLDAVWMPLQKLHGLSPATERLIVGWTKA